MSGIEIAIAAAAAAATIAGGYSQYQQGKEQKKAYDKNAEILRQNASLSDVSILFLEAFCLKISAFLS